MADSEFIRIFVFGKLCHAKGMNIGFGKLGKISYICIFNNYILNRTDIYESK